MNDSPNMTWFEYVLSLFNQTSGLLVGTWSEIVAQVLLHFLWQGFAIAILVRWLEQRLRSPQTRYQCGVCGLLLLLVCPLITGLLLAANSSINPFAAAARSAETSTIDSTTDSNASQPNLPAEFDVVGLPEVRTNTDGELSFIASQTAAGDSLSSIEWGPQESWVWADSDAALAVVQIPAEPEFQMRWSSWLVGAWVLGVGLLSLRLTAGWLVLVRLRGRCLPSDERTRQLIQALAARMRVPCPQVGFSQQVVGAMVVGLWRPMIVLPTAWVLEMSPATLEAILSHELAHLRRHDLWVLWLQRGLETVWFFHPAVWWLSARVQFHRECCCDDLAVRTTGQPVDYATMLEQVAAWSQRLRTPLLAAEISGKGKMMILRRVEQVLGLTPKGQETEGGAWLFGSLIVTSGLALALSCNDSGNVYAQDEPPVQEAQQVDDEVTRKPAVVAQVEQEREVKRRIRQDQQVEQVQANLEREARELKQQIQELSAAGRVDEAERAEQLLRTLRQKMEAEAQANKARFAEGRRMEAEQKRSRAVAQQQQQNAQLLSLQAQLEKARGQLSPEHPRLRELEQQVELSKRASGSLSGEPRPVDRDPRLTELQEAMNRAIKQGQAEEVLELSQVIAEHLRGRQRPDGPRPEFRRPADQLPELRGLDGPRPDGPQFDGPRPDMRRGDRPQFDGPRPDMRRGDGPQFDGPRPDMRRGDGPQFDGPRPDMRRGDGPQLERLRDDGMMNPQFAEMQSMFRELRAELEQMRREMEELRRERR